MPIDINDLSEGWLELESDPGIFTLLLEDLGTCGVQVEEVYDLQKPLDGDAPVYGYIFLFRWRERSRRKTILDAEQFIKDEAAINNMFFAHQVVPNSCATHALLSILLNCPQVTLGPTLSRLKVDTSGMSPDNKGLAIGNTPELALAHNSHAAPAVACDRNERNANVPSSGRFSAEAFHFVSYVPVDGQLFELDGLKPFPIDHGPWAPNEDWTELFRRVIQERIGSATAGGEPYHDIRFSLMAVVPDKRMAVRQRLNLLKTNKKIVLDALRQLTLLSDVSREIGKDILEEQIDTETDGEINFLLPSIETLNTQSSPSLAANVSTDTASECGSSFNSPNQIQQQPSSSDLANSAFVKDFSRLVVVKMSAQSTDLDDAENIKSAIIEDQLKTIDHSQPVSDASRRDSDVMGLQSNEGIAAEKRNQKQRFGSRDLMALLKSLEKEIDTYEVLLAEEIEKRKKYRVDHCRRTHNYDEFICTFLSMLAERGTLASLVEQNTTRRKRSHRCSPGTGTESPNGRHKKGRSRYKRRR
ncbi:ubiquitin carboxyl-terminal hydrolase calypso-like [Daphnia pulicaria]|uniref:ubiquitin carboxyl-terminal hydrolase calypso-like n=1 Tax=Daphnia pulicaria TaxID=35523 RepID=UPI001EEC8380|nr:ubiquitin carboxyl-terminal hydrolase calypso-like [Daphnia pulicaria]